MNNERSLSRYSLHRGHELVDQTRTIAQSSMASCGYSRQAHNGRTCPNVMLLQKRSLHACIVGERQEIGTNCLLSYNAKATLLVKFSGQFITWTVPVFVLTRAPQVQKRGPKFRCLCRTRNRSLRLEPRR